MPVSPGRLAALFALAVLTVVGAACGSGDGMGAPTAADTAEAGQGEQNDGPEFGYEAYVQGMLVDTLSGPADFGIVFNPKTRREYWVLSMHAGADVTSGIYLSRPDTTLPPTGTYEITDRPPLGEAGSTRPGDSLRSADTFSMIYRAGMRRSFVSESGTVELTTANDTLLEGTFQATLRGTASLPGEPPREGQISARGSFRAEKATVGFIFGI